MTAINIVVRRDRIHIMTDGMAVEPEGAELGVMQKVYILGHVPAVIAIRGPTYLGAGLMGTLNLASLRDIDGLVSRLPLTVQMLINHAIEHMDPAGVAEASERIDLRRFDIFVAGWSHRRGRGEVYQMNTAQKDWRVERLPDGIIMPGTPELFARLEHHGWDISDERRDVPRLLELMHHQRAVPDLLPNGMQFCTVGGFAQHTVVTATGIATRVLERWPS